MNNKKIFFYFLIISFILGCNHSLHDDLIDLGDPGTPTISIIEPGQQSTVTYSADLTVSGQVSGRVEKVEVKVNQGQFQEASGTNNWQITVTLSPGKNVIKARSVTTNGNDTLMVESSSIFVHYTWQKKQINLTNNISHLNVIYSGTDFYLTGGQTADSSNWVITQSLDKYNPESGVISPGTLTEGVCLSNTFFYNNRIYVFSGLLNSNMNASQKLSVYTTDGTVEKTVDNLSYARGGAGFTRINDKVYIVGGYDKAGVLTDSILECDISGPVAGLNLNTCSLKTNTGKFLAYPGATAYDIDGDSQDELIIVGGLEGIDPANLEFSDNIYVYDVQDNSFTHLDTDIKLAHKRKGFGLVKLFNKVYIMGGEDAYGNTTSVIEMLDLQTKKIKEINPMPFKLKYMGISNSTNKIYIFGGMDNDNKPTNGIYEYDPTLDGNNN